MIDIFWKFLIWLKSINLGGFIFLNPQKIFIYNKFNANSIVFSYIIQVIIVKGGMINNNMSIPSPLVVSIMFRMIDFTFIHSPKKYAFQLGVKCRVAIQIVK